MATTTRIHAAGDSPGSLRSATLGQLSVRLARLAKAARGSGDPEYNAIARELRAREIRSFPALEKAAREEQARAGLVGREPTVPA